ncbi:unnamed protein product [Colias eurytheme]|nr:unnamed protein product [Colias eurytheme]
MIAAPCDTIGSALDRARPNEYRLYRTAKPVGLRFEVRLGALQTPVFEVIAASRTDQWGARADVRVEPLEDRQPRVPRPRRAASSKTRTLRAHRGQGRVRAVRTESSPERSSGTKPRPVASHY